MSISRKRARDVEDNHCVSAEEQLHLQSRLRVPPPKMRKETVTFVVSDFRHRQEKWGCGYGRGHGHGYGDRIASPTVKAHGHEWRIFIESSSSSTISCFLKGCDPNAVTATFAFGFRGYPLPAATAAAPIMSQPYLFGLDRQSRRHPHCLPRAYVLEHCLEDDGSFVVECDIRIAAAVQEQHKHKQRVVGYSWYPNHELPQQQQQQQQQHQRDIDAMHCDAMAIDW